MTKWFSEEQIIRALKGYENGKRRQMTPVNWELANRRFTVGKVNMVEWILQRLTPKTAGRREWPAEGPGRKPFAGKSSIKGGNWKKE